MGDSAAHRRKMLDLIWHAAISAVAGESAVKTAMANDTPYQPDLVVAVGKAAAGMCNGALASIAMPCAAMVVTKYDHAVNLADNVTVLEAAHPVPDGQSLQAGAQILDRITALGRDSRLLLLLSGGASSLVEVLPEGVSLHELQNITERMLATGKTIEQINRQRKAISLIKDGKLLAHFRGQELRVYAISDVEGDNLSTIGSGLGDCHRCRGAYTATIIASNHLARARAADKANALGFEVKLNEETLYGDVFELAQSIGSRLRQAKPGVYIIGGEPTIVLPENPGQGGRNQSLALALSEYIVGLNHISVLVAGTDGTDGPTDAAGGLVDGTTFSRRKAARIALEKADAGCYLAEQNQLFVTGPTQTNVMDLLIAVVD